MAEEWYFGRGGKAVGPYEFGDIQLMAATRKLRPEDQVSSDGGRGCRGGGGRGVDLGRRKAGGGGGGGGGRRGELSRANGGRVGDDGSGGKAAGTGVFVGAGGGGDHADLFGA